MKRLKNILSIFLGHRHVFDGFRLPGPWIEQRDSDGVLRVHRVFHIGQNVHQIFGKTYVPQRPVSPPADMKLLAETIRNGGYGAEYTELRDAGHFAPWEQPQMVGRLLRRFFDSVVG